MGRAIAREPQAFLLDEPLSNLDAKLRVGMRASLAQLHRAAGRHDRLRHARPGRGDDARPARRGDAGRSDPPGGHAAPALPAPRRPVRRRVHRLAGDEPRRGDRRRRRHPVRAVQRAAGARADAARRPCRARHPARGLPGRRLRAGPAVDRGRRRGARGPRLRRARLLPRRRPPDHRGKPGGERRRGAAAGRGALFTARVDPRTRARVGGKLELAVDPTRFLFFDADTGAPLATAGRPELAGAL